MLSASAQSEVAKALAAFRERVKLNADVAAGTGGLFTAWWGSVTGLDSSQAAVRASSHGDAVLLKALEERAGRLTTDADAAELVRTIGAELKRPDLTAAAAQLTLTGAVKDVGAASLKDAAAAAQTIGSGWLAVLKASPFLVGGVVLLVLWRWLNKRAGT